MRTAVAAERGYSVGLVQLSTLGFTGPTGTSM
jgi:hypothetical protein